jgi:hypothetical protein
MNPKSVILLHTALLGAVFYLISTAPSFAYLDPGSGSMILTAILGVLAATSYSLKRYFYRATSFFRRAPKDADSRPAPTKD